MDPCRLFFYGFSECIEGLLSTVIERIGEIEAMNDGEKTDEVGYSGLAEIHDLQKHVYLN